MQFTRDEDTIIAQCTPQGSGAIAMLRVCGADALAISSKIADLSSQKSLADVPTHTIHHGHVTSCKESKEILDEVLFFVFRAPKTFTGQDTVEISCHNNQFIIQSIIDAAVTVGARLALPGEFTRRAFQHGKLDLLKAEALNDVIHAPTQNALKASMKQLKGSLSSYIDQLEQSIFSLLAYSEASFEFLDEEQRDIELDVSVRKKLNMIIAKIDELFAQYAMQDHLREGVRIALIGSVNAGKSTLFNQLVKKDRSIVTSLEGTTRDTVEAGIYKQGVPWTLIDTAGLRQTQDFVEQEGIRRSMAQAEQADIVILVIDTSRKMTTELFEQYHSLYKKFWKKVVVVASKADILNVEAFEHIQNLSFENAVRTSAHDGSGIVELEQRITSLIHTQFSSKDSPFLLNKRHHTLLKLVYKKLFALRSSMQESIEYELISFQLQEILELFAELSGRQVNEKMMDTVFNSFCVGK